MSILSQYCSTCASFSWRSNGARRNCGTTKHVPRSTGYVQEVQEVQGVQEVQEVQQAQHVPGVQEAMLVCVCWRQGTRPVAIATF